MDVPVEVWQVVFERPTLDFTFCPIGSSVGILDSSIAFV
jgi:hypothetical protein